MAFRLRHRGRDVDVTAGTIVLGRAADSGVVLDDRLVSRRHAVVVVSGDQVTIEDLGTRNGTIVNGERIVGKVELHVGDRMLIGAEESVLLAAREPWPWNGTGGGENGSPAAARVRRS
jgi:pSer/pThr/pTyr-binding forkhead associated (FHA) protein